MKENVVFRRSLLIFSIAAFAVLAAAPGASAQGDRLSIHGFGSAVYGQTDNANSYATGTEEGQYDNTSFTVNLTANLSDETRVVVQVNFEQHPRSAEDFETELDYAFGAWKFSDRAELRLGRVKQPFGIYTEYFDVGTLRPFLLLPQGIYGPQGIVSKHYDGAGLSGLFKGASGWGLQYDVYGGQLVTEIIAGAGQLGAGVSDPNAELVVTFKQRDVLGTRLAVSTPVQGLQFGASAYTGDAEKTPILPRGGRITTWGLFSEYLTRRWSVRGEYVEFENKDFFAEETWYAELAYKLTDHWQVAARQDEWEGELLPFPVELLPRVFRQSLHHEDTVLALNYWVNPNFVIKLNFHQLDGNRFSFPSDPLELAAALAADHFEDSTNLIEIGLQFSF